MKKTTIEEFAKDPQAYLKAAQREQILVTRQGQPLALVVGMVNKDEEDFAYESSPEFWQMIRERRRMPTIPLKDVEKELFGDGKPVPRTGSRRKKKVKG